MIGATQTHTHTHTHIHTHVAKPVCVLSLKVPRTRTRKNETVNQLSRTPSTAAICNLQQTRLVHSGVCKW